MEKNVVLAIATVMDPRYKIMYFEFSSSKYGGKDGNIEVSTVLMAIRSLYDDYNTRFPTNQKVRLLGRLSGGALVLMLLSGYKITSSSLNLITNL